MRTLLSVVTGCLLFALSSLALAANPCLKVCTCPEQLDPGTCAAGTTWQCDTVLYNGKVCHEKPGGPACGAVCNCRPIPKSCDRICSCR